MLAGADRESLRGKRNYAMLAMLVGCGLRRGELLALRVDSIQLREEHWVIADLLGKAGHILTVPIPGMGKKRQSMNGRTPAASLKVCCSDPSTRPDACGKPE
ncbi:MAG: tyrosine-type recombinase/integrase [Bryobacteraceae bacterium]